MFLSWSLMQDAFGQMPRRRKMAHVGSARWRQKRWAPIAVAIRMFKNLSIVMARLAEFIEQREDLSNVALTIITDGSGDVMEVSVITIEDSLCTD